MTEIQIIDKTLLFANLKAQIDELTIQCNNIIIVGEKTSQEAKEAAKTADGMIKAVEEKRFELTKPLDAYKKEIMAVEKSVTGELIKAKEKIRGQIRNYEIELEKIRQKEIDDLRKKQAELEEAERQRILAEQTIEVPFIDEETGEFGMKEVVDNLIIPTRQDNSFVESQIAIKQAINAAQSQKSAIRYKTTYRVTNINLVPLKYLMVNDAEVQLSIKAGVTNIQGIEFYKEPILNLR